VAFLDCDATEMGWGVLPGGRDRSGHGRGALVECNPKRHWPDHPEWKRLMERHWSPVWGDRRQELVFIGTSMDEAAIRAALNECLTGSPTATRFDPNAYRHLRDPFPFWGRADAA
jgi:hypothetical protein